MTVTGREIVDLARTRIGQEYVFGVRVDLLDPGYAGPWDCAEFATWLCFQTTGRILGTVGDDDPYSGAWARDILRGVLTSVPIAEAASIAGAILVRRPTSSVVGHVAVSDGQGGTVEAHSRRLGVATARISGRRWDLAGLLPDVEYRGAIASPLAAYEAPAVLLRLVRPYMRGELVGCVQRALASAGHDPGLPDGVYGPKTAAAVFSFQLAEGLAIDGEVGPETFRALRVSAHH